MALEYMGYVWRQGADPEFWKRFIRQPVETTKQIRRQPEVRHSMLKKIKLFPTCEACGGKDRVQPHHIQPAANFPKLAALMSNLISLCWHCHRVTLGHPRGTRSYNPNVRGDAARMLAFVQEVEARCVVTKSHKWFEKQKAA